MAQRFLCGVPGPDCGGSLTQMAGKVRSTNKAHETRTDAFNCHTHWRVAQGYTKVGPRELASPNGGPILVLSKKSKFGYRMTYVKDKTRFMPYGKIVK